MVLRSYIVILVAALSSVALRATTISAAEERLTWDAAVQEAERANPDLSAARNAVEKAVANNRGSFSGFLPQSIRNGYLHALEFVDERRGSHSSRRRTFFDYFRPAFGRGHR